MSPVAWVPEKDMEVREWLVHGRRLGAIGRAGGWWIGDWVSYGNARYGEKYSRAAKATGYDMQTLMNMAYVASRLGISRRRENLSWSHHAELAALRPQDQDTWLDRCEADNLSVHDLRTELRQARREGHTRHKLDVRVLRETSAVACPQCGFRFEPALVGCHADAVNHAESPAKRTA